MSCKHRYIEIKFNPDRTRGQSVCRDCGQPVNIPVTVTGTWSPLMMRALSVLDASPAMEGATIQ